MLRSCTRVTANHCLSLYSHFIIQYARLAPCTMQHAPCTTHHAPCTMHHAPCTMHHAPCTTHHAPRTMHHAPCSMLHAPSHGVLHRAQCAMHHWHITSSTRHHACTTHPLAHNVLDGTYPPPPTLWHATSLMRCMLHHQHYPRSHRYTVLRWMSCMTSHLDGIFAHACIQGVFFIYFIYSK